MKYLILQNPGHNRVYYDQSEKLAMAELSIAARFFKSPCLSVNSEIIAGIRYIGFESENELQDTDIQLISGLSFVFAIFKYDKGCFFPVEKNETLYLPEKLSAIQKYHGKTNELFTRMMISVAALSSDFYGKSGIRFLDPVSGRGTGLFEAAIHGFDAYGIEKDHKSVHDGASFFKTFLKKERFKHEYLLRPVAGTSKKNAVRMHDFEYARNKEEFSEKSQRKHLGMVEGDTLNASGYFKADYFHLIAGDLPYGIVHGNMDRKQSGGNTRNPSDLLQQCLPEWYKILKPGGCIVMSWNSFLLPYKRMADLFEEAGFSALKDESYTCFEHRVDQAIKRNIIVAKKV